MTLSIALQEAVRQFTSPRDGLSDTYARWSAVAFAFKRVHEDELYALHAREAWTCAGPCATLTMNNNQNGVALTHYSFLGYITGSGTGSAQGYRDLLGCHSFDLTRPGLRYTWQATQETLEISPAAALLVRGSGSTLRWWSNMLHQLGATGHSHSLRVPHAQWDADSEWSQVERLQRAFGWTLSHDVNRTTRLPEGPVAAFYFLRQARTISAAVLESFGVAKGQRNLLLDGLYALQTKAKISQDGDLLHLVLNDRISPAQITPGPRQRSLLHAYAAWGNTAAVLKLLEAGHSARAVNVRGHTPAEVARNLSHPELSRILQSAELRDAAYEALEEFVAPEKTAPSQSPSPSKPFRPRQPLR